ncbi:MAG: fatty acid desaturase [Betaproteobacteria bacterium]
MSVSTSTEADPVEPTAAAPSVTDSPRVGALARPLGVAGDARIWPFVIGLGVIHLVALLAFVPWFFSWTGVVLALLGLYFYGTLGINLAYHRILTHKGLSVPKWLERALATLGVCCLEYTPARWIAVHRMHHQYSDEQRDPHSPLVTPMWGHMGWLGVENRDTASTAMYERYARDILKDPYYFALERKNRFVWINLAQWLIYFLGGFAAGWIMYGEPLPALQFGASVWLWGVIVRTVAVWHISWSVNSLSHLWGYQTYETGDNSRNNWFVAWISNGEGWHNNHHADQIAASHGHRWWELDVTWMTIRLLEGVGLATDVVRPRAWKEAKRR